MQGYRARRSRVLKPKSMSNEAVLLKGFFHWCKQRNFVAASPLENMKFHRPKPTPRGGPSINHIFDMLGAANDPRETHIALLAFTGMRSGELRNLRPSDMDLDENWIHIVSREGARTKTGQSRKVPIHDCLRPYLVELPKGARPWLFTAPPSRKYPDGDHHINTKHLNEYVVKLLKSLDLPAGRDGGFTTHSLRHSFETITVNAGIPQRVIDTWLGHQSDRSMASVYYCLSDEDSQKFMTNVPFTIDKPRTGAGED